MSSIVDKAFDATQKIMRTIFRGSPNLFTTADLNRQIEAFDYRLKRLEWFRGIETDMTVERNIAAGYNTIYVTYSYIRVFGCTLYEGVRTSGTIDLRGGLPTGGIGLFITPQVLTYSDDPSHDIAGAKFQDGDSKAAADQQVIGNWGFAFLQSHVWDSIMDVTDQFIIAQAGTVEVTDLEGNAVPDGSYFIPLLSRDLEEDSGNPQRQFQPLFHTKKSIVDTTRWFHPIQNTQIITNVWGRFVIKVTYNKFIAQVTMTHTVDHSTSSGETGGAMGVSGIELPTDIFPLTMDALDAPLVVKVMTKGAAQPVYPTPLGTPFGNGFVILTPDPSTGKFKMLINWSYSYPTNAVVYFTCDIWRFKAPDTSLDDI